MGNYPLIQVPFLTGGIVIAIVALVHIVFAHYSVGAGFLIYSLEKADPNTRQRGIQRALDLLAGSVVYINFILGALTGVGIWFSISLFSTDATEHLIQKFVWLWATEWTFFVLEIVTGYVYFYYRNKLDWRARMTIATIYMVATWLSLVVITGILSYMLTASQGNALESWFNDTTLASIGLRTIGSTTLAAIVLMVMVNIKALYKIDLLPGEDTELFRVTYRQARWMALLPVFYVWFHLTMPDDSALFVQGASVPIQMFFGFASVLGLLVAAVVFWAHRSKRIVRFEGAMLLLALCVVATFSAEFVREGVRKPFVIRPLVFSNGMQIQDLSEWQQQANAQGSVLKVQKLYGGTSQEKPVGDWLQAQGRRYEALTSDRRGELIYQAECMACHSLKGYNDFRYLVSTWAANPDLGRTTLRHLNQVRTAMPPFVGTDADVNDLIEFASTLDRP